MYRDRSSSKRDRCFCPKVTDFNILTNFFSFFQKKKYIFFSPLSTHIDPLAGMVAITESITMSSNGLGDSTMRFRNRPNQHHFRHRRKSRQL